MIALNRRTKLLDYANRLVPDGEAARAGIFTLQSMDIRSTDRGCGYTDKRVETSALQLCASRSDTLIGPACQTQPTFVAARGQKMIS